MRPYDETPSRHILSAFIERTGHGMEFFPVDSGPRILPPMLKPEPSR